MNDFSALKRIQIVLVEPQDGANVGAVCRAMKTMALEHLVVVGNLSYDEKRIRMMAVHAYDVWENHQRYATLKEAVADSTLVVGTSRRRGKKRKNFALTPEELAARLAEVGPGKVSLVFGRETDGLTDQELKLCNVAVHIPTSEAFPSLNLAQAVQIIAYILYRECQELAGWQPIVQGRLQEVVDTIGEVLAEIDFYKGDERPLVESFFRDILARSTLSEGEAQRLEKIFIKLGRIKVHKNP